VVAISSRRWGWLVGLPSVSGLLGVAPKLGEGHASRVTCGPREDNEADKIAREKTREGESARSDSASSPPPSLLPLPPSTSQGQPRRTGMASSCLTSPAGAALCRPRRPRRRVACSAAADAGGKSTEAAWLSAAGGKSAGRLACGVLAAWAVASASNPVIAASQVGGFSPPPFLIAVAPRAGCKLWNVVLRNVVLIDLSQIPLDCERQIML
jgi:hypothetical protein